MSAPAPPGTTGAPADPVAAIRSALATPEQVLTEPEGFALLDALGVATPRRLVVSDAASFGSWDAPAWAGERVVLKAVSRRILHKTEHGAVAVVPARREALLEAARAMEQRLAGDALEGFLVCEFVPHETGPGREFLLGVRRTAEFGPVVTLAAGGVHAEFLARALRDDERFVATLAGEPAAALEARLGESALVRLATEAQRGQPPRLALPALAGVLAALGTLATRPGGERVLEMEINPLVIRDGALVALDVLVRVGEPATAPPAPRPIARIARLLEPRSIAIVGVSNAENPGRIILRNLLREGFPPAAITVVKPGIDAIEGCRAVPDLASLGAPVDLLVLAVSAAQAAEAVGECADRHLAESIVLIPGGLEEREGARAIVARMRERLERSRRTEWGGPVVNGGNCLGVRSRPGRCDTLFIPEHKLARPLAEADPVALVTGSGAFAVARTSQLAGVHPLYTLTIGNQTDLTAADYLEYLRDDSRVGIVAVYLEGFRPGDGARFLAAARELRRSGRTVVLYLAGRTVAGARAAASHTASVAGDFALARRLACDAGVVVADSLDAFDDLVRLFVRLRGRRATGPRLGAVTNAGFEAVAIADTLGPFRLADWAPRTQARMRDALTRARLQDIVTVHDPVDLTPMLDDAGYDEVFRAALEDPGVDLAVLGCVPLTQALVTLPAGPGHAEDLANPQGIVCRLVRLWHESAKPWVAVVDAGPAYDAMARTLEHGGVPVFRTADRALRALAGWYASSRANDA